MADHIVPLAHLLYVNQFAKFSWDSNPSLYRCMAACGAMVAEWAYPGRQWQTRFGKNSDINQLEDEIYTELAGPDTRSDTSGITKAAMLGWLGKASIGVIDMQHYIDLADMNGLRAEMEAQNRQGVLQFLCVNDESHLKLASNGSKMHNWADQGLKHAILRVGYSDSLTAYDHSNTAYYYDPASPSSTRPTGISRNDINQAGIFVALAIMPPGVPPPPHGFSYQKGAWPTKH